MGARQSQNDTSSCLICVAVLLLFILLVKPQEVFANNACLKLFKENSIIDSLEFMDSSHNQDQSQTEVRLKLIEKEKLGVLSRGLLPSLRQNRPWGELKLPGGTKLIFGGPPKRIKGKAWIPVFVKPHWPPNKKAPVNYKWLSMESLYRVYGDAFFESLVNFSDRYLAPIGTPNQQVYQPIRILKYEGTKLLVQTEHGRKFRMSRADFFEANLLLALDDFISSIRLNDIQWFYENGGRGEIVLNDSATGHSSMFEGYYIHVTKFPEMTFALFDKKNAYDEMKAAHESGVMLFYGDPMNIGGVVAVGNTWFSRIHVGRETPFIVIKSTMNGPTFAHEKTHYDDYRSKTIMEFLNRMYQLEQTQKPKGLIDFKILAAFILEQRAYKVEDERSLSAFKRGELTEEEYETSWRTNRTYFDIRYGDNALIALRAIKKNDPVLFEDLVRQIRSFMLPSDTYRLQLP